MTLYHTGEKNTKNFSQVAYAISCYPWEKLSEGEKKLVFWKRTKVWTKQQLLDSLEEEMREVYLPGQGTFSVRWVYGNIPTEHQWNYWDADKRFLLNFRISPALPESTRIVVLDLLPFSRVQARKE